MRTHHTHLRLVSAAAVWAVCLPWLSPPAAWGYGNLQFRDARTNIVNTLWNQREYDSATFSNGIPWMISTNFTASTLSGLNSSQFRGIVSNSFATWQSVPETRIRFTYGGITTNNPSGTNIVSLPPSSKLDGDNIVGFGSLPSGVLGLTCQFVLNDQYTFTGTNNAFGGTDPDPDIPEGTYPSGTVLDADIQLSTTANWSVTGEYGKMDLQAVITHEIGHFIGLSHSVVGAPYPATMYPFAENNPDGLAARSLYADDRAGVAAYYPAPTFSTTFGSISGQVRRQDNGKAVPSAHVVARLTNDLAHVVACYADTNGQYRIDGLVPGAYILRVEPLPKVAMWAGINTIVTNRDLDFLPQIYANGAREADATLLIATASDIISNCNLTVLDGDVADLSEDDDVLTQAKAISTDGNKEFHNVCPAGDIDYFTFNGVAGMEYLIRTADYGSNAVSYVTLSDSSGMLLAAQKDDSYGAWIAFQPQHTDDYHLAIKSWSRQYVTSDANGAGTQYSISILEQSPITRHVSVTTGSDTTGTGSQGNPWGTIRHALTNVTATARIPISIRVAGGTYPERISLPAHISLYGGFAPSTWVREIHTFPSIIDGGGVGTNVTASSPRTRFDGFTVQRGRLGIMAEGLWNNPIIALNTIISNTAPYEDSDTKGGGLYINSGSSAIILNNTIRHNTGRVRGGGILVMDSVPLIYDNHISHNNITWEWGNTWGGGAGIHVVQFLYYWSAEMNNNRIIGNHSNGYGGGLLCSLSYQEQVQRNIISCNSARLSGGGLFVDGFASGPRVDCNVFAANCAGGQGGAAANGYSAYFKRNIFVGNNAQDASALFTVEPLFNNVFVGNSAPTGSTALVVPSSDWTYRTFVCAGNTVAHNAGDGIGINHYYREHSVEIDNNIIWRNSSTGIREIGQNSDPSFCFNNIIENCGGGYFDYDTATIYTSAADINTRVSDGQFGFVDGNVDWQPDFMVAPSGWAAAISYDSNSFQSTLSDPSNSFIPGALAGIALNPNTNQWLHFYIVTNTASTITVWGDMTAVATAGCRYAVFDWHLSRDSQNIDAGTNLIGAAAIDMDGESRPTGAAFDIGADEFVDGDGDDLASVWEARYGLNPSLADTDGDGMPDGWELAYRDPWVPSDGNFDTDGDGMPDSGESIAGTDPDDRESLFRMLSITR